MKLINLIFGLTPWSVQTIVFSPVQTTGAEADARRAALAKKAEDCIARMGDKYRLHGRIERGTHAYVLPKKPSNVVRKSPVQWRAGNGR